MSGKEQKKKQPSPASKYKVIYLTPLKEAINNKIDELTRAMVEQDAVDPKYIALEKDFLAFCYKVKDICESRNKY